MKKLAVLLATLLLSVSLAQGFDLEGRTVIVGSDTTYPPFETINEAGETVGFDVDVINAICDVINCVAEFKTYAWDGIVASIAAGTFTDFDMVASGVSITEERDKTADFSSPYLVVNQAITVRTEDEDLTLEMFEGGLLTLGAQLGTTNAALAEEIAGAENLNTYDDFNSAVQALLNGDIDGVVIDGVTADAFVDQYAGDLVVEIRGLSSDPLGFVFQEGDELMDAINEGLAAIQADGTLDALIVKWFGE